MGLCNQRALQLGHEQIAPEHILLGVLDLNEGVAIDVLDRLGVNRGDLQRRIEAAIAGEPDGAAETRKLSTTPPSKQVIANAIEEGRKLGHTHVGTEHLLLGLSLDAVTGKLLADFGLTVEKARDAIRQPGHGAS